ncbi:MAG TPA: hypothetical protein VMD09_08515 [Solirubrobacteraceae bacterium]|nr:hypothetical protein [Solirubrobacteraceae bacterium]
MSFTERGAEPAEQPTTGTEESQAPRGNMLPGRQGRRFVVERVLIRLVATGGIVGIGVLLGAVLGSNNVQGWIVGLVVALVTVVLSALLWSSRQL